MSAICLSAAVSWALVWHAPLPPLNLADRTWSTECFAEQAGCEIGARAGRMAFSAVGADPARHRAECVEQPAVPGLKGGDISVPWRVE